MTYETKQELRDEIATLYDVIRELAGPPLSAIEHATVKGANDGRAMQSIADEFGVLRPTISKIAHKLRRRGLYLPNWPNHIHTPKPPPRRFRASGTTPEGCPISCAADTQKQADDHIAPQVAP